MKIISLFCEIDDFFLVYEKCKAAHELPSPDPRVQPCDKFCLRVVVLCGVHAPQNSCKFPNLTTYYFIIQDLRNAQ